MRGETADVTLHFAQRESARFGLRVLRGSLSRIDAASLEAELRRQHADIAIVRIPAEELSSLPGLEPLGIRTFVADTLVHYGFDLRRATPQVPSTVVLRGVETIEDRARLEAMVRQTFADYSSHYHANPIFSRAAILDGYVEWALDHTVAESAGMFAWLGIDGGHPVGFSCARLTSGGETAIGTLNGILPEERRRGMYRGLLRETMRYFATRGVARFEIATQAHNVAVQRVWQQEGLLLDRVENTVYLEPSPLAATAKRLLRLRSNA